MSEISIEEKKRIVDLAFPNPKEVKEKMIKVCEIYWNEEVGKTTIRWNDKNLPLSCYPTSHLDLAEDIQVLSKIKLLNIKND